MPARPNPAVVLADRLVAILKETRDQGAEPYPLHLSRLAALAGPQTTLDVFQKAIKHKNFTAHTLIAQKKAPDSFVALQQDVAQLAGSDMFLVELLEQVCSPAAPAIALPKLVGKVEKPLRAPLAASIDARLKNNSLPSTVAVAEIKKKLHLFLKRMPPPRPADVELTEKLLAALESRRHEANGFPWTMKGLLTYAAATADPAVLKKVLASKAVKPRLVAVAKGEDAPLALSEDTDKLMSSAAVLSFALKAARSDTHQALSLADLKKKVNKPLQPAFAQSVEGRIARRDLPQGVGLLKIKKQPCFFFLADAVAPGAAAATPPPPSSALAAIDFASAFEQAFNDLDRQSSSVNFVSLVDLRRALAVDRATFDQGLRELRRTGRFSLTPVEGRHGLTPEQQAAAINENGQLLLFVNRRP